VGFPRLQRRNYRVKLLSFNLASLTSGRLPDHRESVYRSRASAEHQSPQHRTYQPAFTKISTTCSTSAPSARTRLRAIPRHGPAGHAGRYSTFTVLKSGPRTKVQLWHNSRRQTGRCHPQDSGVVPAATCRRTLYHLSLHVGVRRKSIPVHWLEYLPSRVGKHVQDLTLCQRNVPIRVQSCVMLGLVLLVRKWGLLRAASAEKKQPRGAVSIRIMRTGGAAGRSAES